MKEAAIRLAVLSLFVCMSLFGCSGGKERDQAKEAGGSSSREAAQAIRDYGKRPIDKARAAQQLGDERTDAIDKAGKP